MIQRIESLEQQIIKLNKSGASGGDQQKAAATININAMDGIQESVSKVKIFNDPNSGLDVKERFKETMEIIGIAQEEISLLKE